MDSAALFVALYRYRGRHAERPVARVITFKILAGGLETGTRGGLPAGMEGGLMSSRLIDLFAALLIFLAIVKVLVLFVRAPAWLAALKALYANRTVTVTVSYALAGAVLYGLLDSGLTIVQILAVSLFVVLLVIPGFAPYMGGVLRGLEGKTFQQMMREQWLYTLVWTVLLGWGLWALLSHRL